VIAAACILGPVLSEAPPSTLTLPEAVPLAHALVHRIARDVDVRVLFIKGPAAVAQGLRSSGTSADVDALVDPSRLERLRTRLAELGWVDPHPYSTPTAADYSRTHRHPSWPCELDLHVTFPGLYADRQAVFERLWARRAAVDVAGLQLPCPDVQAHTLVLALNSLRDGHSAAKTVALEALAERVTATFGSEALTELGELAGGVGASDTSAPFLAMVGAPNEGLGSTSEADLQAWRLRTQPAWRVATWLRGVRQQPLRSRPSYLWRAVVLSEAELRSAHPELPPGRKALARARWRRIKRGLSAAPSALNAVRNDDCGSSRGAAGPPSEVVTATRWRSLRIPPRTLALVTTLIGWAERAVVVKSGVVIRTGQDFDDQGLEMAQALHAAGLGPLAWLVKGTRQVPTNVQRRLPPDVRLVDAGSLRGLWTFLRARVVVHTHGLYGIPPRSRRQLYINLWHGWGSKELAVRPPVAARQSDVVTVCSASGQRAVAAAWGLDPSAVVVTGLPRNDVLVATGSRPRPDALNRVMTTGVPLVLWLPTYRRSTIGELRVDGIPFDNDFQLPDCHRADIEALAEGLGVHIILKTHPMSAVCEPGTSGRVTVWEQQDLLAAGLSLYELMGQADLLVTDYSSVWVDYLLLDRPIVFVAADDDEYAATRGHDPALASREGRPGPIVRDLGGLEQALGDSLSNDSWSTLRRALRTHHHQWTDGASARRVAAVILERL
jgi:CDP-glycerol glycerophosphotransferase (TagB/SpsB family)